MVTIALPLGKIFLMLCLLATNHNELQSKTTPTFPGPAFTWNWRTESEGEVKDYEQCEQPLDVCDLRPYK